ncbi:hypothetical protein FPV67DRAFT_1480197 [Lyophyllum atratum]|nr:hypothetical protein FPV67DRAFT_1480197 [Lyophyllum atratum]
MQFTTHIFAFLAIIVASVLAAPASIERRAANLQISLRETGKNTAHWHFGLVIHAPGGITGGAARIHEHLISNGCLAYDEGNRATKAAQLSVTGNLVAANNEATDAALDTAAVAIIKQVPGSAISANGFNNCFDFAVEAVRRLNTARYVSQADYAKFSSYHNTHAAAVRAKTDAATIGSLCTRANGKPCGTGSKAPVKAPAKAAPKKGKN